MSGPRLVVVPITLREANAYVERHHRHHDPVQGAKFAIAAAVQIGSARVYRDGRRSHTIPVLADELCGVAFVGRPVARALDDGWTAEVTRLATDGTRNACSFLYGAAWRAARAQGYVRCGTYTLPEEGGASLRASQWRLLGEAGGGSWDRAERPRVDLHPTQGKLRWEVAA